MKQRRPHHGFTLLELVLVLVIICIAMAAVAPSLGGWSRGSRLRDAGDQLLAVTRYARTQAVGSNETYRLNVDSSAGRYWLSVLDGQEFVNVTTELGGMQSVPQGYLLAMTDSQSNALNVVDFFPTGRTTPAHIRITGEDGATVDVQCQTPAEGFRIPTGQEQPR